MSGGRDSGVTFVCGFKAGREAFARGTLNLGGNRSLAIAAATIARYSVSAEKGLQPAIAGFRSTRRLLIT
jgi:hypothetical protein